MVDVWITTGLPASGKSTWSKKFKERGGAIRFNMDDIRAMMGFPAGSPEWNKDNEKIAFDFMLQGIVATVQAGRDVVIDNTHLNRNWAAKYKTALQFEAVDWWLVDFTHVPVEECIKRDSLRPDAVGENVIKRLARGYQNAKTKGLLITEEWLNERPFQVRQYKGNPGKPKAILVDFDGTLALMDGRGPYEFWRVDEDKVAQHVHTAVKMARAYGYKVIGCSGRDQGVAEAKTRLWMAKHAIVLDELIMRKAGDRRRDDVVKHDLFFSCIAEHYDVDWVLDDRDRVVDTWRAMGIPCFQVARGDF